MPPITKILNVTAQKGLTIRKLTNIRLGNKLNKNSKEVISTFKDEFAKAHGNEELKNLLENGDLKIKIFARIPFFSKARVKFSYINAEGKKCAESVKFKFKEFKNKPSEILENIKTKFNEVKSKLKIKKQPTENTEKIIENEVQGAKKASQNIDKTVKKQSKNITEKISEKELKEIKNTVQNKIATIEKGKDPYNGLIKEYENAKLATHEGNETKFAIGEKLLAKYSDNLTKAAKKETVMFDVAMINNSKGNLKETQTLLQEIINISKSSEMKIKSFDELGTLLEPKISTPFTQVYFNESIILRLDKIAKQYEKINSATDDVVKTNARNELQKLNSEFNEFIKKVKSVRKESKYVDKVSDTVNNKKSLTLEESAKEIKKFIADFRE